MNRCTELAVAAFVLAIGALACDESAPVEPENQAPVANAGINRTEYDTDGDGRSVVSLDGSRSFDRDGTITSYVWTDGGDTVATVASTDVILALGVHGINLVVEDDRGKEGSAFVLIAVRPPVLNRQPSALIISPADGSEHVFREYLLFRGMGSDPDEGPLSGASLRWTVDGQYLGTGSEVETIDLSTGVHQITLTATDAEGAVGRDSISVSIRVSFAENVLPIFQWSCVECHSADRAEGGIRLDSYEAITTGENRNGPLVVAGDPTQGILIPKLLEENNDYDHVMDGMGVNLNGWLVETILTPWILDGLPDN